MKNRNVKKFSIKMQKKLVVLFILLLFLFIGLIIRLVWITRENETDYQKQVLSQQQYTSTTIPFRRGNILDVKGTRLATSEKVYNLVIDAKVMNYRSQYLEPTLKALGDNFDLDMTAIRAHVTTNKKSSWYVPLRQLTYEEISGFQEAQQADSNIQGVWFEEEYRRIYPYGSLASDVIGFSDRDNMGRYGLEEYYNDTLNGVNGREYGYLNDDLTLERTVKSAVDGYDLHSTIDANLQMMVEKYLKQYNDEQTDAFTKGNGAENVGCVMMDVNTGEVLAMASYPPYDLNDVRNTDSLLGTRLLEEITNAAGYKEIRKTDTVITEEVLASLSEEQLYVNLNYLWQNYCITGTYEPGSTAKPFTVASALEDGVISPDLNLECNGVMEIGGYDIKCHNGPEGWLTLEQAVANSCNVSMMKIAQLMGTDEFCEFQQIFNIGLKTNIDLAGEARTANLVYVADNMGPTDLATNSFGQNYNVTMIEMIAGFCSLINGGYYYEPHVVNKITNSNGATVQNIEPRVLKQTVSESTSELIRQYCRAVVAYGTGVTARPAGYMIGGKTGTAETIDPNTNKRSETEHVVSFIGYAPADDPQIAIYVVVDRPNSDKQGNARYATKIVRNILTEALPYLNIFMTEEVSEEERQELEALQLSITSQYTQTPESGEEPENGEGAEGNQTGQEGNNGTGGEGNGGTGSEGGQEGNSPEGGQGAAEQPWMAYPIDPETGYRVDPATGRSYDAQTGAPIDQGESVPDPGIPVNPNLPVNPNME
ncbi:penicillin-binding transpeptidase domain-containing protein [Acetatifactor aquisgranensis]|uniref:penicillin-binding transpeptidase domain-containing protein n=1 Tax=Acetatifactor aquisgranensis TaxID=2941233 RepID=UPI00203E4B4F|nr:penicillin-binding transpeptidase domain-containing protein [Acetatifactor aquisgranensis]